MQRATKTINYDGRTWRLCGLFPADFFTCSCWPFAYYRLPEDGNPAEQKIKRDWKLKPKNMRDDEAKLAFAIRRALKVGCGINSERECDEILSKDTLKVFLLAEIYALTYQLNLLQKYFTPFENISREFAEALAIKAKTMNIEPYALLADVSRGTPELYNPKRYDFNWFILGIGWERERREYEKAQVEMKSKIGMRKR
jgi:hypothetical protein